MAIMKDITGIRYNRLVALRAGKRVIGGIMWEFQCDCGGKKYIRSNHVKSGRVKSCGCWNIEALVDRSTTHGLAGSPTYRSWQHLKERCTNPSDINYHRYGGRGITFCERWNVFENFLEDMGEKPEGLQIDRIDNDGNYEPGNCRWVTGTENIRNASGTKLNTEAVKVIKYALKHLGISKAKLAEIHKVSRVTIYDISIGKTWRDVEI